jgi:hypothetical protein
MILAVIIILKNIRISPSCPIQQGYPPSQAHGYTQRELVRGRHIGQPSLRRARKAGRNDQPFIVNRDRDDSCAHTQKAPLALR